MKPDMNKVSEVFFSIGDYFGGFHRVIVSNGERGAAARAYHNEWGSEADSVSVKVFSSSEWSDLLAFLSEDLHVREWKREYIDPEVLDGTQWCLSFTFTDGTEYRIEGSNAYPPEFDKLEERFEKLYDEINDYQHRQTN